MAGDEKIPPTEPTAKVKFWLTEIEAAKKREASWREDGDKIQQIYDGTNKAIPFNILYSNTETLLPAVYSAVPRPVVQRRFKDEDPLGKQASLAGERMLEFLADTNLDDYQPFDDAMKQSTLDALLPGRGGATCVKYDADVYGMEEDEDTDDAKKPMPSVEDEIVCVETKQWNRCYYGYAKTWMKVPWIAFEEYIDKKEATRLFGTEKAEALTYTSDDADEDKATRTAADDRFKGARTTVCVYQIWDRRGGKKVLYLSDKYQDDVLKEEDDPLELAAFFPCPKPLQFVEKTFTLTPTALYKLYENQATELNQIQLRINKIVQAIKARGIYDGSLGGDLEKLMQADDNTLVPAESASSLAAEKGLSNAIWFMPLTELVTALQQLYAARESCKQVIYEITGISDILRGSTSASETATAQQLKSQWGSLRLKRLQKEVARYARDLFRLMLELAATKLSEDAWAKMTGLPFTTTAQVQQAQQVVMAAQVEGRPPDAQAQALLAQPSWGAVLALLKDDLSRSFRIDIETNSTVEPEAAEDHQNITDMLTALGQYLNGVAPLVANGTMPFEVAQGMMLAIARRFRFGTEIEDYLRNMKPPQPQDNGTEAASQQKALQAQQQMAEQSLQVKQQQGEMALQAKSMQAEKALLEKSVDLELREMQLKMEQEKFEMAKGMAERDHALKTDVAQHKLQGDKKIASMENAKFKTENVVNQKADATLGKGMADMKALVQQLVAAIGQQSEQHAATVEGFTKAMTAPKTRKAVRDKQGRIESVTEETMTP